MLLWLGEAVIEVAMILAVAIGAFMLVAAAWSLIVDGLRGHRAPPGGPTATQRDAAARLIQVRRSAGSRIGRGGRES